MTSINNVQKNEKNEKWKMFLIFKKMKHFKKSNYSPEMNFNTDSLLKAMFANYESSREMRMLKFFFWFKKMHLMFSDKLRNSRTLSEC